MTLRFLVEAKKLLRRNDKKIPRRRQKLLCRNDIEIPRRSQKASLSEWQDVLSFWRSLFGDWRILTVEKLKVYHRSKRFLDEAKNFSVGMTLRFLVEAKKASLSEWQYATVILKELFATEETFSVGMTIRHCHSEGAFRDWRNFLCRNDKTPLSFWRSFSRLKNLCLSEWQKESPSIKKTWIPTWSIQVRLC